MPIRADHLTLTRLLLLPVPIAMLYREGTGWTLAALLVLVALGLTDVFDGPLARKYGSTRIGPVLDSMVDRVFVAVLYSVFADLGVVPTAAFAVLVGRDLLVVGLRGIATESPPVGVSGKLKGTVQMIGAGFLLLLWIFREGPWIHGILWTAVAVSAVLLIASWRGRARPDWRASWATALTVAIAVVRLSASVQVAIGALVAVILGITLVTAAMLAWSVRREAFTKLAKRPVTLARLAAATLVVPLIWIPLVQSAGLPILVAAGLGAAELSLLSLGSALAAAGTPPDEGRELARSLAVAAAGVAARVLALRPDTGIAVAAIALITLIAVGGQAVKRFARTARSYAVAAAPAP